MRAPALALIAAYLIKRFRALGNLRSLAIGCPRHATSSGTGAMPEVIEVRKMGDPIQRPGRPPSISIRADGEMRSGTPNLLLSPPDGPAPFPNR